MSKTEATEEKTFYLTVINRAVRSLKTGEASLSLMFFQ